MPIYQLQSICLMHTRKQSSVNSVLVTRKMPSDFRVIFGGTVGDGDTAHVVLGRSKLVRPRACSRPKDKLTQLSTKLKCSEKLETEKN